MKIFLMLATLFVYACGNFTNPFKSRWYKPNGRIFGHMPKTDNKVYIHGWQDGCESGLSTGFGKEFNKQFYAYKKDIRFVGYKYGDDRDLFDGKPITPADKAIYGQVWGNTFKACRDYAVGSYKAPGMDWGPAYPGAPAGKWDDPTLMYEFKAWNNGGENIAFW